MPPRQMIAFDEALAEVLKDAVPRGTETTALADAAGRILAADALSDMDMPPFDKSAMDGFALPAADPGPAYRVELTIAAGDPPGVVLQPGTCARIMTGAPVPASADRVVRIEYTALEGDTMTVTREERVSNVCCRAEDVRRGDVLVKKGTRLNPAAIGVLASAGVTPVPVYCRPRVGIIATGSEVVEPDRVPGPGCIRNSNSYQLCAQVAAAGGLPTYYGIAADREDRIRSLFLHAAAAEDVVLVSGGVSMGDFDLVPGILAEIGAELVFESIAVKPGKPTVFGRFEDAVLVGLPGNPVSTLVIFELLVKPLLFALAGHAFIPPVRPAILKEALKVKSSGRTAFLPVRLAADGTASVPEYHGSAHLAAYVQADGLIRIDPDTAGPGRGDRVYVRPLWT